MLYLAAQIWFHLLLAFALGAVVLWAWLRRRDRETGLGTDAYQALQAALDNTKSLLRVAESDLQQAREEATMRAEELAHRRGQWAEASAEYKAEIDRLRRDLDRAVPPVAKQAKAEPRLPEELLIDPATATVARDDLKQIKGIGRVLEGLLNQMDIYTFREIAAWGNDDIERVQARLPRFPGRIRRDGWVHQAAALDDRSSGQDRS